MTSAHESAHRPYLVIVRAGNSSLHPKWLEGLQPSQRKWDLIVNYFGDDPDKFCEDDVVRIDSKGPKMPALHILLQSMQPVLARYRYIWLPDDDLACRGEDINRLFEICEREGFHLAQPALRPDSYLSHLIVLHNPMFQYRVTSFVELMAPCFDLDTLLLLLPTFSKNLSGWGIDNVIWPRMLQDRRVAVIDEIQITHTRPVGAANYVFLGGTGKTAGGEMQELLDQYGAKKAYYRVWSAQLAGSRRVLRNRFAIVAYFTVGLCRSAAHVLHWNRQQLFRNYLTFLRQHLTNCGNR